MRKLITIILFPAVLILAFSGGLQAQDIHPTPFFTGFADTTNASTYNGNPLVIGSVIQAFDQSGVYCGVDFVREDTSTGEGIFGYFPVYGDDPRTETLDEGAVGDEQIIFKINGRTATVTAGDDTWSQNALKSVTLTATGTIMPTLYQPAIDRVVEWGDTVNVVVRIKNDGNGIDFYGVTLSMSVPDSATGPSLFLWEATAPDTAVYADSGEVVPVSFDVRVPIFNAFTVDTVYYTVFSHLDTTKKISGSMSITMALVDVDEPESALPGGFTLNQNYPNPFNPTTTIPFTLPMRSQTRLEIYNVLGRQIDVLDLGALSDGPHEVAYDASPLASGIYFYRLVTEYAVQSRKMILVK
ncbi:MAG TPA: T9SS type A sorting domain-containing protein [Acidobacteriota bacterium]|nr:T9SS type A sorting domain-containing protein [Acidobacteriota bacterium]